MDAAKPTTTLIGIGPLRGVPAEALKSDKPRAEFAQIYGVHPSQITQWRKQLLDRASSFFEGRQTKANTFDVDELYKKVRKLEMERDFLV